MSKVQKKHYPKDFIFDKTKTRIDGKNVKQIPITEHTLNTEIGKVVLVKGQALTKEDLQILNDYQKGYYLDVK